VLQEDVVAVPQQQPRRAEQPPVAVAESAMRPTVTIAAGEHHPSRIGARSTEAEVQESHVRRMLRAAKWLS